MWRIIWILLFLIIDECYCYPTAASPTDSSTSSSDSSQVSSTNQTITSSDKDNKTPTIIAMIFGASVISLLLGIYIEKRDLPPIIIGATIAGTATISAALISATRKNK
ncbi:hypothetical protein C1645_815309 [Glomus cerebriforme]|uniref:Uncharacterized protein n=1 Tax=Glomus cerebriforme TaxID=658196 RepID=A0A397TJ14_9GLOM|nr:hypothetical protein C1645_815309 [Glomus cerebriforme]